MKLLPLAWLSALLWLTGCASTGVTAPPEALGAPATLALVETRSMAPPDAPKPLIPDGELKPITSAQASSRPVTQLSAPADLWERIARGFAMPDLQSELVTSREQWYDTRPDYVLRMTERSRKYLFYIVEELERRNMPTEIALLPFIESAFNPQAVSSAKASGMWQFMPATGKNFDLKQNAFRDDRRDVLASTRAALDYLQKLHDMFGDWQLALAAYNWGEGSVSRAIAKNQRLGLGTSYTDLKLPPETRLYVPKLQAVKNLLAKPEAFSARLPLIENHPYFQSVDIRRDIDVELAAKLAGIPLEDFKALNPSASRPVILAAGTPQILLPWDNAKVFEANLAAYTGQLASWMVWVAPTTMKPAAAAKQAGMSEAEFRSVNHIPPRVSIKAGSSLLVPRPVAHNADVTLHLAEDGQITLAPDVIARRKGAKAGRGAARGKHSAVGRAKPATRQAHKKPGKVTRVAKH